MDYHYIAIYSVGWRGESHPFDAHDDLAAVREALEGPTWLRWRDSFKYTGPVDITVRHGDRIVLAIRAGYAGKPDAQETLAISLMKVKESWSPDGER
jgi:hypothetical protein